MVWNKEEHDFWLKYGKKQQLEQKNEKIAPLYIQNTIQYIYYIKKFIYFLLFLYHKSIYLPIYKGLLWNKIWNILDTIKQSLDI